MLTKSLFKKYLIFTVVVSLVAAALLGILTLLGGEFNDVSWQVLFTTLTVGVFSITALASLRGFEAKSATELWASRLGILASLAAMLLTFVAIWIDYGSDWDLLYQSAIVASVSAVGFAHISLLLPFRTHSSTVKLLTLATSAIIIFVASIVIGIALIDELSDVDGIWRLLGVFAILDVLGTILLPVLAKTLPKSR